jgi:hypothetical protein
MSAVFEGWPVMSVMFSTQSDQRVIPGKMSAIATVVTY